MYRTKQNVICLKKNKTILVFLTNYILFIYIYIYYILWENTKYGVFVCAVGCGHYNMKSIENSTSIFLPGRQWVHLTQWDPEVVILETEEPIRSCHLSIHKELTVRKDCQ